MNEHDITICVECKHCRINQDGPQTHVWYNWFCQHPTVERQLGLDPVTGDKCYFTTNSLGMRIPTTDQFPYCRNVNDGYCETHESGTPQTGGFPGDIQRD